MISGLVARVLSDNSFQTWSVRHNSTDNISTGNYENNLWIHKRNIPSQPSWVDYGSSFEVFAENNRRTTGYLNVISYLYVYGNPYLIAAKPDKVCDPEACSACHKHVLDTYNYYLQRQGLTGTERREQILDLLKRREMSKMASVDPSYMLKKWEHLKYSGMPEYFLEMLQHPEYEWIRSYLYSIWKPISFCSKAKQSERPWSM